MHKRADPPIRRKLASDLFDDRKGTWMREGFALGGSFSDRRVQVRLGGAADTFHGMAGGLRCLFLALALDTREGAETSVFLR